MGVIARSKPQPSLSLAEQNYNLALAQTPSFCLAESYVSARHLSSPDASAEDFALPFGCRYLTELRMQANNQGAAAEQFSRACSACGAGAIDMEEVKLRYSTKGWAIPSGTACSYTSTVTVDWIALFSNVSARALSAAAGASRSFVWAGSHNVYKFSNQAAFDACDFSSAQLIGSSSPSRFIIPPAAT